MMPFQAQQNMFPQQAMGMRPMQPQQFQPPVPAQPQQQPSGMHIMPPNPVQGGPGMEGGPQFQAQPQPQMPQPGNFGMRSIAPLARMPQSQNIFANRAMAY